MAEKLDTHAFTERARHVLREHFTARIDVLRRKNDHHMDPTKTAAVRGGIAECIRFLNQLDRPGANLPDEYV